MSSNSNAKFFLKVVLSILAFGLIWIVSNQAAVITAVTILIVWALNMLFKYRGIALGRTYLTGILYAVAFLLVVLFNPTILPSWPTMPSDVALAVNSIATYLQMVVLALFPYSGAAMTIYNMLMRDVLDGLSFPLPESTEELIE